ncbi:MAG: 2Fe-2S iron-sulfur cluster-binding protein, partial [Actinomycetota bacterium]|nr:2Fe-2S iron-sulfur cluster-binding protein [Actinomycetota bacterium]
MISFNLNGSPVSVSDQHEHLLSALRDELGVISPKDGCAPSGQCGCCTVLVGDKARVACQTSLERVAGEEITTLEGFDQQELDRYCEVFAANGALQCGFCIPGILVRAKALIQKKGEALTRDETARHLGAHLCRCTGYVKILDAIEDLATGVPVSVQPPKGVGSRGTKYEAEALAAGVRPFIDDMDVDGLLHGALK